MSHLVQGTCELSLESRPLNQISCQSAVNQKHTSSSAASADLFYLTRLGLHKQEVTSATLVFYLTRLRLHKQEVTSGTLVLAQVRQGRLLVSW